MLPHSFAELVEDSERILDRAPRVIEFLPLAIYACDATGRLRWFNKRAAEIWGREPRVGSEGEMYCGSYKIFDLDGRPIRHDEAPMGQVLKSGIAVDGKRAVVERPDGSRVVAMVHIEPIKSEDGEILGAINCFHDVTEVDRAQTQLQEREQWYRDLLEALPAAIYTTDSAGRITFYNQAAVDFSGRRPVLGTDEWCVTWRLYQPDGTPLPHDECPMAVALKEDRPIRGAEAIAERPDGTRLSFIPYPTPLHDEKGKLVGAVNMLVDITGRKRAERRLALLAQEVDHRSKNMLAIIQAMVRFTRAETIRDFAATIHGRVTALAHAHTLLSENRWDGADLKRLVDEELAPYRSGDGDRRIQVEGGTIALMPVAAQSLAIVVHELTTNAVKHGALAKADGRISIRWNIEERDGGLVLHWREKNPAPVCKPSHQGFGISVIERTITDQLDGDIDFHWMADGLSCDLRIPPKALTPQ